MLSACSAPTRRGYEYMPDMVYSLAYDSFAPNPNTRDGLTLEDARRVLWMYTSRETYRMLVHEAGWSPDRFEAWLRQTIADTLIKGA